jgi:hypothetical protein
MAGRTYKTEAVVLRSFRLGEADRVLHLYTLERGRVGAVAKGVRRTKSRFGARLEPLSHIEVLLHQGSGELQTVTGVELLHSHRSAREDGYRLNVGLIGLEAMLRLFTEQEANQRAFRALTRFLELLDELAAPGSRALFASCRRRGVLDLPRRNHARARARRPRRDRIASAASARRRKRGGTDGARGARRARRHQLVVRVPRRLSAADAVCLTAASAAVGA